MACQGKKLPFPEIAVGLDPLGGIFHRLRCESAVVNATLSSPFQQTRVLQHTQVLGVSRYGFGEGLSQAAYRGLSLSESSENSAPSGICQGSEGRVQPLTIIINHMVKYNASLSWLSMTSRIR